MEENKTATTQGVENKQGQNAQAAAKPVGLNLGSEGNAGQGGADYGRVAELERELQSMRVENGRAKALADQVRERDAEIERLRAELDKARAGNRDIMSEIPEDLREQVDPVTAKALGAVMDKRLQSQRDEFNALRRRREEEDARLAEERFLGQIEQAFPGFLRDTNAGGDKFDAWNKFLEVNRPAVFAAFKARNLGAFSTLVNSFFRDAGVQTRGQGQTETPRPASVASMDFANPNGQKRVYSVAEYASLIEKAGTDFRSGAITLEDYKKVRNELSAAKAEGRVR